MKLFYKENREGGSLKCPTNSRQTYPAEKSSSCPTHTLQIKKISINYIPPLQFVAHLKISRLSGLPSALPITVPPPVFIHQPHTPDSCAFIFVYFLKNTPCT